MGLTAKEIAVLQLRSQGLTQNQVAKRLKISQAAVSSFEQNAYRKLKDAEEILSFAKELGLKSKKDPYEEVRYGR
ncbi:helix-turn-helix domain-containing protein [Candidatus Woesearchaeota archaeon]|nr:helix-turn-helix domain-containing protein [Candidatus Woesearchaeota archaeon]